jgi:hypothetical protein
MKGLPIIVKEPELGTFDRKRSKTGFVLMKKLIVVLALSAVYCLPIYAQSLWESGSDFLRLCEAPKGEYEVACGYWLVGVQHGSS